MVCRRVSLPAVQGRLRDQLLNEEILSTVHDARQRCALWQHDYNNLWPHSSPGGLMPVTTPVARAIREHRPSALSNTENETY